MIGLIALAMQLAAAPQSNADLDYDCDVPQGSYDKKALPGSKGAVRITGTIAAETTGKLRAEWAPAAGVLFQPPESKQGVGLQLWLSSKKELAYGVRRLGLGSDSPTKLGSIPKEQSINFGVALDSSGTMIVTINETSYKLTGIPFRPESPILMCSGGHFKFTNVNVIAAD